MHCWTSRMQIQRTTRKLDIYIQVTLPANIFRCLFTIALGINMLSNLHTTNTQMQIHMNQILANIISNVGSNYFYFSKQEEDHNKDNIDAKLIMLQILVFVFVCMLWFFLYYLIFEHDAVHDVARLHQDWYFYLVVLVFLAHFVPVLNQNIGNLIFRDSKCKQNMFMDNTVHD